VHIKTRDRRPVRVSAVVSAVLSGFVLAARHADKMRWGQRTLQPMNREKLKAAQANLSETDVFHPIFDELESGIPLELGS
jgi:hypothetical protein